MNLFSWRLLFFPLTKKIRLFKIYYTQVNKQQVAVYRSTFVLCQIYTGLAFIWPSKINTENKITLKTTILDNADKIFENGRYEECYNLLISCKEEHDVEIKWRICRVLYNMSKDQKYEASYKKKLISRAYQIIASELDSNWNNHAVQKWYAIILDAKSTNAGMTEKIEQLGNVRKHMDLAVTLNPDDATTLHMLGEWCYQVTEISWLQRKTVEALFAPLPHSTYEDALEYFLRAETAQPRFYSINLLRIGICYLKLKKEDQAKYYLKLAASYPAKSNNDHQANKEAMELLKKLK
ncbi:regulator of microtubule dynamics protein 1-like isoform X2 [Epargyreus clarus]|uniref:regulator of microtubule dynamics protein 1-like isoform X2 n=1 Tax=Epargyreus clarus TaxID=520877 RepID=UPI003C30133F